MNFTYIVLSFLVVATSLVLETSFDKVFSELENTYTNEKCGVSIQYPKDWTVEEKGYTSDLIKTIAQFQSTDNDIYGLDISIQNFGLSQYSMEEIAEEQGFEGLLPSSTLIHSGITDINGFPAYEFIHTDSSERGEFHRSHLLIIAYDREYRLNFDEPDKADFDKYSSIVNEMGNSIKITKPNFEGINC